MINPRMWPRWLAMVLLGPTLTIGCISVLALASPGQSEISALPWMLLVFPIWVASMSLAFVFQSAKRMWLWLGAATLASFGFLHVLKACAVLA